MVEVELIEPYDFDNMEIFFQLLSAGFGLSTFAIIAGGLVGFTISKLIKIMIGR